METQTSLPTCFICGGPLRLALTRNKNGKVAVTLFCAEDGRHLRAFVNHRPWVEEVVARLEAQAAGTPALTAGADRPASTEEALQKPSGGLAPAKATRKRRRTG
jgi:hypothetical protein